MHDTDSLFAFNGAIFHLEGSAPGDKSTLVWPSVVGSWLPHALPMGAGGEERQSPPLAASRARSCLQRPAAKDTSPLNKAVKNKIVLWLY